jgi:dipeptidase E
MTNLMLVSTTKIFGSTRFFDYIEEDIIKFVDGKKVMFIPYAQPSAMSLDEYTAVARKSFEAMGLELYGIQESRDTKKAVESAEFIYVGGGNTFVLNRALNELGLVDPIWAKVFSGTRYLGSSAGSNVATPNIMTTNDMPIVYPPTFNALNLVPFNINPHYIDPIPEMKHMGETRETRIKEFLAFNKAVVVGLREGTYLRVIDDKVMLLGSESYLAGKPGARIFKNGSEPTEHFIGEDISALVMGK